MFPECSDDHRPHSAGRRRIPRPIAAAPYPVQQRPTRVALGRGVSRGRGWLGRSYLSAPDGWSAVSEMGLDADRRFRVTLCEWRTLRVQCEPAAPRPPRERCGARSALLIGRTDFTCPSASTYDEVRRLGDQLGGGTCSPVKAAECHATLVRRPNAGATICWTPQSSQVCRAGPEIILLLPHSGQLD